MAIVKAINAFKFYLYNHQFTILSDTKCLEHFKHTSPADLIIGWLVQLLEYDYTFNHVKGKSNYI